MTHLALDLTISLDEKSVRGTATLDFARRAPEATELELDAAGFEIFQVTLQSDGQRPAPLRESQYVYDGETLTIPLPPETNEGKLSIEYRAVPKVGLYFLAPDAKVPSRPRQVWSQCQDEDGHHWFPCQDKPHVKMTTELRVSVPHGMTVLSNGNLVEKLTPKTGNATFHYRLDVPHPAYLVTLVVGAFDEWEETATLPSGRKVPLRFLVPKGRKEDGKRAFSGTARMLRLLSEKTGVEYPWETYTQVVVSDFIFGGMENTTATTMYEHILLDERATLDIESHDLVVHELGHQWFGDLVTCRDWSHAWLNEGFATFVELLEREDRLGRDEYDRAVSGDLDAYLGEAGNDYQRAIVCRDYDEPIDLFDRHLYQKGGLVLHMLRRKLGDTNFFAGVRRYLETFRGKIVETNDLMRVLEEVSGTSLERFFDEWVYRPGHPNLDVKVAVEGEKVIVDVTQLQTGNDVATFELPFEVALFDGKTWTVHARRLNERKSSLVIAAPLRPEGLIVDPDFRIAAPLELTAPLDILQKTLENAASARGKSQALAALRKKVDPKTLAAVAKLLGSETVPWMARVDAAAVLANAFASEAEAALLAARHTKEPRVRRAVAAALGEYKSDDAVKALTSLSEKDPSYLVIAQAARSLGKTKSPKAKSVLGKLLGTSSWADVATQGALDGLARLEDDDLVATLLAWSAYGKPLRARRTAIAALARVGEGRKVREHLVELLRDTDPHLRIQVLSALEGLNDPKAKAGIHDLLDRELDGRVTKKAKRVLSSLGSERAHAVKKAREETQALEKEVLELKTRLSKLEQSQKKPKTETKGDGATRASLTPSSKAKGQAAATSKAKGQPTASSKAKGQPKSSAKTKPKGKKSPQRK